MKLTAEVVRQTGSPRLRAAMYFKERTDVHFTLPAIV